MAAAPLLDRTPVEPTEPAIDDDGLPPVDAPALTDEELTALALAAEPDPEVDPDGPSLYELTAPQVEGLLPSWYMPAAHAGTRPLRGWRRVTVFVVVGAFLGVDAVGLCTTYGPIFFG